MRTGVAVALAGIVVVLAVLALGAGWIEGAVAVGTLVLSLVSIAALALFLLRRTYNGIAPEWLAPVLDPDLPPLGAGTPQEWLAGRSALGSAGGSATLRAAAVRSAWWMPEPRSLGVADVRFRVDPDPSDRDLVRATKAGLRAARRALPGRGAVRASGGVRRVAGPDVVTVRLVVRAVGDGVAWARLAEEAFATEFAERMGKRHTVARET